MSSKIEWESVSRSGKLLQEAVWVGVRKTGLKISSGFYKLAKLRENKVRYVLVRKSEQHQAILLHFLPNEDLQQMMMQNPLLDGIYTLLADGGGKLRGAKATGAMLQVTSLIKHTPWLLSAAEQPLTARKRYIPEQGDLPNQWILRLTPGFIYDTSPLSCDIPSGIKGIYCYIGKNEEILYIGQGSIRARFNKHAWEKNIKAVRMRWTPIDDADARKNAEDFHLNQFVRQYGRLPRHNITPARLSKK